jgi:hypothetical protein
VFSETTVWFIPPKQAFKPYPDTVQLTQEEVRMEQARQLSIELGVPTRVRGARVEILLGDTWAETK